MSFAVRGVVVMVLALAVAACPSQPAGEGEGEGEVDACASCGPLQACKKSAGFAEPGCVPNQCTAPALFGDVCDDEPTGSGCADGAFTIECREGTCVVQTSASGTTGFCIAPNQVPESGHCFGDADCVSPLACANGVCTNACASCGADQACAHDIGFDANGGCTPDHCAAAPGLGDECEDAPEDTECGTGAFSIDCLVGSCVTGPGPLVNELVGFCIAPGAVPAGKSCFESADCVAGLACSASGTCGEGEGEGEGGQ